MQGVPADAPQPRLTRRPPTGAQRPAPTRHAAPPRHAKRKSARIEPVHDVVIVGGGPAGSSCAYWLADAGWDVVVVEKKHFPRVKTCGDGLTPRAVRQLADMGLEDALAGSHKYSGLRAYGFGQSLEMQWPEHPNFPSYGYTITRHDLDGLVADRAVKAGATLLTGTEVVSPDLDEAAAPSSDPPHPDRRHGQGQGRWRLARHRGPLRPGGRRGQLAGGPHAGHRAPPRPPARHGPARLLLLGPPRRPLHRVAPRHPRRRRHHGPRLRLDLPHGRRAGQRRASACSPPTAAGRASTPPTSWTPS